MFTERNLQEVLPGFKMVASSDFKHNLIQNPEGEVVARHEPNRETFVVFGDHSNFDKVMEGLGRTDLRCEVEREEEVKQAPRKAQNYHQAYSILNSLKGQWGNEGMRTIVEHDLKERTVTFKSTSHKVCQELFQRLGHTRQAIFGGTINKELEVRVPVDLCGDILNLLEV